MDLFFFYLQQFSDEKEKCSFLLNQAFPCEIIRNKPLLYCQPHQVQHKRTFNIDPRVTPPEVPGKGKLIYVGTMAPKVKLIKMFSVSTSLAGLCLLPGIVKNLDQGYHILAKLGIASGVSFFIFITPVLIHFFTKRYVTWMYFEEETNKFTATTYNFLAREVQHVFTPEEVTACHGALSSIKVKNKPLIIDSSLFFDREMYVKLMGYDKPHEWMLPEEEELVKEIGESKAKDEHTRVEKEK